MLLTLSTSPLTSAVQKRLRVSVLLWQLCFISPWRFLCLQLCVRLIVASLHCWCCSARKTHPLCLSLSLIGCHQEPVTSPFFLLAPCLFLHSPLLFSSIPFILWPFLYCLHPDFHSAFRWCQMKCVHLVCDWQDLSEQEERFSQAEEGWHGKTQSCSTAPLKASCCWFGGCE